MCFSESSSFITSAVTFSTGLYALIRATKYDRHYVPLSLIPIIFSIQQFSEGMIWKTMATPHIHELHDSVLLYMFFAFLVWPAYFPFCLYCIEPDAIRRKILVGLMLSGIILGAIIYIPLLMNEGNLNVTLINKSIAYSMERTVYSQRFYTISYAIIIFLSSFFCSRKEIKRFGLLVLISFILSITWFLYAFISIWCYFAALLSLYIVYIIFCLPGNVSKQMHYRR